MQMETNHMSCSAVRNASPPHLASPPVTATWNTVHKLKKHSAGSTQRTDEQNDVCRLFQLIRSNFSAAVCPPLVDDLPDLQEVQEEVELTAPPVFQVAVGVSHQERHAHAQPPDTHWLTQLAHIATGPQSPLLQESAHSR